MDRFTRDYLVDTKRKKRERERTFEGILGKLAVFAAEFSARGIAPRLLDDHRPEAIKSTRFSSTWKTGAGFLFLLTKTLRARVARISFA